MISDASIEAAVETSSEPRHIALVRITHWIIVLSVIGLLVSGIGILVSHPRLYWGETGAVGTPSLIDLPIPFIIGPSVSNRPFHFFFAWILVLTGLTYVVGSFITQHFRKDLLPAKADLRWNRIVGVVSEDLRAKRKRDSAQPQDAKRKRDSAQPQDAKRKRDSAQPQDWKRPDADAASTYNVVQRLTYLAVVFGLFPAILWTGLAMSFGVTSVFPILATVLGGHQSARTLHFVCVVLLLLFVIVHVLMIYLAGFWRSVRAMITGYEQQGGKAR
jgi:thiosulfate reductase cytochrome b subunit